jgi:hypothetical protein
MNQQNLAFDPPAARYTDPASSHEAEHKHTTSGKRACNRDYVRQLVSLHPGSTARELARFAKLADLPANLPYHEVMRRLNDLCDKTLGNCDPTKPVIKGPTRKCAVSGKMVTTWEPK